MPTNVAAPLEPHHLQVLPKARLAIVGCRFLGEPAVQVTREVQSARSACPDDWHRIGESIAVPVTVLEEFVALVRHAARDATE